MNHRIKIVFIGTVKFSYSILECLVSENIHICGVVTGNNSGINCDYYDLGPFCLNNGIPKYITNDVNDISTQNWIKQYQPDIILCIGWSRLLKKQILDIPKLGVIGYHPAELPKNRGRHPIIWAIVLGLKSTASTFIYLDEGIDNGDIISQKIIEIGDDDYADELMNKLIICAKKQILKIVDKLQEGTLKPIKQNLINQNTWRKRTKSDGEITWKMSVDSIYNLVRGLSRPYCGAHIALDGKEYKIWKCHPVEFNDIDNYEPGKIIKFDKSGISVKCGVGSIKITNIEPSISLEDRNYL